MQANTGFAVFAGAGAIGELAATGLSVGNRIKTLKAMQADLTGRVPSDYEVLMGSKKLHPMVAKARGELSGGKALAGMAVQVAGTIANAWMMLRGNNVKNFIPKSIGITMGTSMVSNAFTASDTALVSYQAMAKSFKRNGRAELEQYIGLVGGLQPHADEQAVQQFAQQAFEKQLKQSDVVRLVSKTDLMAAAANDPVMKAQQAGQKSLNASASKEAKPVVGKFTGNLAAGPAANEPAVAKSDTKPVQGKFTGNVVAGAPANDPQFDQAQRA
jgi:hypothetical protein